MSSFVLKKKRSGKYTYLVLCETYHDEHGKTIQIEKQNYGNIDQIKLLKGIDDPYKFYKEKVDKMNADNQIQKQKDREATITEEIPQKNVGYFLPSNLLRQMKIENDLNLFGTIHSRFHFNLFDLIQNFVYAQIINPQSVKYSYENVFPTIYKHESLGSSQYTDGIKFIGEYYKEIIEIMNKGVKNLIEKRNTKYVLYDCTNYYFEIDFPKGIKQKGPSKENRNDPIVGMGLLLDADAIPMDMVIYSGNQSELPTLRDTIRDYKNRETKNSKMIQIADKGLNCAENIYKAVKNGDGYIFSKSILKSGNNEIFWVLQGDENKYPWTDYYDENGELEYRIKSRTEVNKFSFVDSVTKEKIEFIHSQKIICTYNESLHRKKTQEILALVDKAKNLCDSQMKKDMLGEPSKYLVDDKPGHYKLNQEKIMLDLSLAGYNEIVTSEIDMNDLEIYKNYHRLWEIEESFRIMKSYLDARPVHLQKDESITGHFTIVYIAVMLLRLLQKFVFHDKLKSEKMLKFIREFNVIKDKAGDYMNMLKLDKVVEQVEVETKTKIRTLYWNKSTLNKLFNVNLSRKKEENS